MATPWLAMRSSRPLWEMELQDGCELERGGERKRGSRRCDELLSGLGEDLAVMNQRRRPSVAAEEEDEAASDAGRPSARGQGGVERRMMAEAVDSAGRRGELGGRGRQRRR